MGLAIGIAASTLLLGYVSSELSYDDFHSNNENIYRIRFDSYKSSVLESSSAIGYYGAAPAIKENFPEVLNYVRLHRADGMYTYHPQNGQSVSYHEKKAFYSDSTVFSVFNFQLIKGNKSKVLRTANSLVISESAAGKYFGQENPIGKTISLTTEWEGGDYLIEGVFKDVPDNSHIKFDFLIGIEGLLHNNQFKNGAWYWWNFYTYLVLQPGIDPTNLEQKFLSVIETYLGNELRKTDRQEKFALQRLSEIHLHSNLSSETEVNGNYKTISALLIVSFIIIGIAWLNYINLSTAKATERAREVGVRKLLGSNKRRLIVQFLVESVTITSIAIILAVVIVLSTLPFFHQLIGRSLVISIPNQISFWIPAIGIMVIGTFFSGLYPAFHLSSFQPVIALKGKVLQSKSGVHIRKLLVVIQFSASALLIIATLTIFKQLQFMRNQDLGMNIKQKVVVRAPKIIKGESYMNEMDYFKNRIKTNSQVVSVSTSSEVPGKEIFWSNEFRIQGEPESIRKLVNILAVDEDFIPTFNMTILAGRNFSKDRVSDFGSATIINESALKALGLNTPEQAIDQELTLGTATSKKIIGVIKDFHQQSLKEFSKPTIINYIPWRQDYITISITGQDLKNTIASIESTYRGIFPGNAFEYFFLDDQFNLQYQSEEREWKLFILFALLSVLVASMGLFGLSSFLTIQRAKEIAVRKVLGASVPAITFLLSKDFIKLVLVALVLTVPLSWFLMKQWLMGFAYHIDVPLPGFVLSAVLMVLIALLTISFQTIKAAFTNPVESLKNE
ncbi:MAG: ABC transporter permease [Cyclobacteriaceae bacterium]|nr:ABC transporter permease [Cyclobacteriaceae bacterium]